MKKVLMGIVLFILLVTACSPQGQATEGPIVDEEPMPTPVHEDLVPAEEIAITTLSENLGLPVDEIRLISTEAMQWPDACFGLQEPGLACAEVITRGFRIDLEANGKQVEYRTNEDGTRILPATVALTWKREGGIAGFCDYLTVYLSGEVRVSSCKPGQSIEERLIDVLSEEEWAQLNEWLDEYGEIQVDASDPQGVSDRMVVVLAFTGLGSDQTLTSSEQQELLNFAQELYQRLYK